MVEEAGKTGFFEIADDISKNIKMETEEDAVISRYSLDWLNRVIKAVKAIEPLHCSVFFGQAFPIKFDFSTKSIQVNFFLGPRV